MSATVPEQIAPRAEGNSRERVPFFEEQYFLHNLRHGTLHNRAGTKMAYLPGELILGLHETLQEELGDAWRDVMARIGRIWGKRVATRFHKEATEYYNRPIHELPMREFIQLLEAFFSYHGWGKMVLDFSYAEQGIIAARLENSAFVELIGASEGPVDSIVAGLLADLISQMSERSDLVCYETECQAQGVAACRFVLGIESRLLRVPQWLGEGRSHEAIIELLCHNVKN